MLNIEHKRAAGDRLDRSGRGELVSVSADDRQSGVSFEDAIENIDIGGPSMFRAAAKNHAYVTVVTDVADYDEVMAEIEENGNTTLELRKSLAAKVFRHTAAYDAFIADYLTRQCGETFPERFTVTYEKMQDFVMVRTRIRSAAFYRKPLAGSANITTAEQLHGKELSYNNINDANAALQIVKEFDRACGCCREAYEPLRRRYRRISHEAYQKAYDADPTSIFGGIVAANRRLIEAETANCCMRFFLEIVIAPDFTPEALEILEKEKHSPAQTG